MPERTLNGQPIAEEDVPDLKARQAQAVLGGLVKAGWPVQDVAEMAAFIIGITLASVPSRSRPRCRKGLLRLMDQTEELNRPVMEAIARSPDAALSPQEGHG